MAESSLSLKGGNEIKNTVYAGGYNIENPVYAEGYDFKKTVYDGGYDTVRPSKEKIHTQVMFFFPPRATLYLLTPTSGFPQRKALRELILTLR